MMSTTKVVETTKEAWALEMTKSDYELLDYLMACMAYDMGQVSASLFNAHCLSYMIATYGEDFTLVGHDLYKKHLREKHSYAR